MSAGMRVFTIASLAVAVGLATAVSPFASSSPDGLNKVAEEKGFLDDGKLHSIQDDSPIPGYAFPGIQDEKVAKGVAGFVGTLAVFGFCYGLARLIRSRGSGSEPGAPAGAA